MNIEKIKSEFIRIKSLGFLENVKSDANDGGAGNTFENHLGVTENNLKEADFEGFEVKTKKSYLKSKSPVSLFTLKPSHPADGDSFMRENWGIPDKRYPNVKRFSTSLYAHRWSLVYKKYNIRVEVNRTENKLYIVQADLNQNILNKSIYWSFDDLEQGTTKLKNMFLVDADMKSINGKDHFHYTNATILIDYKGHERFLQLIEEGLIRYDNRLGVYGPKTPHAGKPHNHGGGFRLDKKHIDKLYNTVIEVE
jgi:hypothetical protein